MAENTENYGLDSHCLNLLNEYRRQKDLLTMLGNLVQEKVTDCIKQNGIAVTTVEGRVKEEKSLAGKLLRKGYKYAEINDITDLYGIRIVTLFSDDVDKIAALVANMFDVDWQNSVDKRKIRELNTFGYSSLHYICRVPKTLYSNADYPEINEIGFEIQMRTTLQHVWSAIEHDIRYKGSYDIPDEYSRTLNILAGMFELADREFSTIRTSLSDYRHKIFNLVGNGRLDEVPLSAETFEKYLQMNPFENLNKRIASINQAEVVEVSLMPYLVPLKNMGMKTLGDVERMKKECSKEAYELARHHLGSTDLDILTSVVGIQNLCVVYTLRQGKGKDGLVELFELTRGHSENNKKKAEQIEALVKELSSL